MRIVRCERGGARLVLGLAPLLVHREALEHAVDRLVELREPLEVRGGGGVEQPADASRLSAVRDRGVWEIPVRRRRRSVGGHGAPL